jgi:heme oxygenase (biliverdin-IX-beta and delta-forming)
MNFSLLERLKLETTAIHAQLESRVDIRNRVRTTAGYRALLEAFYGVCCPLESKMEASEIVPWLPDIGRRMRTSSLRLDLQVLGNNLPEALPLASVPALHSLCEKFGSLYVLEGSTLGGQLISREIHTQLHYTPENGCAYFASYGADISSMWRKFREAIEAFGSANSESHDSIIHSAISTFGVFADWIGKRI